MPRTETDHGTQRRTEKDGQGGHDERDCRNAAAPAIRSWRNSSLRHVEKLAIAGDAGALRARSGSSSAKATSAREFYLIEKGRLRQVSRDRQEAHRTVIPDVAAKYKGDRNAAAMLGDKIKKGGTHVLGRGGHATERAGLRRRHHGTGGLDPDPEGLAKPRARSVRAWILDGRRTTPNGPSIFRKADTRRRRSGRPPRGASDTQSPHAGGGCVR